MIQNLKSIYSYFIFASVFLVILSLIFFFTTKKYKKNRVKLLSLFTSLNNRSIILISSFILNFMFVAYFAVATKYYTNFVVYLIIINSLISIIVSLNLHMIVSNIIYTTISIFSLKIINLVYNYLTSIYYDTLTAVLGGIFVLMVIVYELFITVRQLEIVLKKSKPLGGVKNDGKPRESSKK